DVDRIIQMIVGRSIENAYPKRDVPIGELALRVHGLTSSKFRNVSFEVRRGEILGISGLVGAGRTEILDALFGCLPILAGSLELFGKPYIPTTPADGIAAGLAYVTEDRRRTGLVLCRPVDENINLIDLRHTRGLRPIRRKHFTENAETSKADLDIRLNSVRQLAGTLSGGNQQKTVVAKWLLTEPKIVLFDEPTRGIDIKAKASIYELIGEMVARHIAVVMVSSELPELLSISDRILVMREGEPTATLVTRETSQEEIMRCSMQ
ncbi:MAG: ATP-binding cassette domain-containing protein, partial [Clostridia bacterium]|nr:ATP-binding cassette domain-containing protein [Clostridia bacterium]